MNSLLGNLGNVFKNLQQVSAPAQTAAATQTPNILLQALGAALRHEDPHIFMENLAKQHPQLRQYDLSNLQQTAQTICQQKGVDANQLASQIDDIAKTFM